MNINIIIVTFHTSMQELTRLVLTRPLWLDIINLCLWKHTHKLCGVSYLISICLVLIFQFTPTWSSHEHHLTTELRVIINDYGNYHIYHTKIEQIAISNLLHINVILKRVRTDLIITIFLHWIVTGFCRELFYEITQLFHLTSFYRKQISDHILMSSIYIWVWFYFIPIHFKNRLLLYSTVIIWWHNT